MADLDPIFNIGPPKEIEISDDRKALRFFSERRVPVTDAVRSTGEILGIDGAERAIEIVHEYSAHGVDGEHVRTVGRLEQPGAAAWRFWTKKVRANAAEASHTHSWARDSIASASTIIAPRRLGQCGENRDQFHLVEGGVRVLPGSQGGPPRTTPGRDQARFGSWTVGSVPS